MGGQQVDLSATDAVGSWRTGKFTDRAMKMFTRMDKDGDGVVTQADLQAARAHRHMR